jgi:hypothetical protein
LSVTRSDAAAAREWLDAFARRCESSDALDHLVKFVDDRTIAALPEFNDPTLRAELHASTRAHWKGFLAVVAREAIEVQPAPQIFDLARTLARRGCDLPLLMAVYRIGQRSVWQFITELLEADVHDPALRSAVLLQFWSHAAHWLDTTVESLIVVFTAEREQWQRGALARRAEIVNAILAGHVVDIDSAVTTLAYPLRQNHIAFTVRVDERVPDFDVQQLLESAARAIGDGLGGGRPLIISSGARAAWCWTAMSGPPSAMTGGPLEYPKSVRVTMGVCHPGPDGFRLSHTEAIAGLRLADGAGVGLVRFEDVEIACLAAGILDDAARAAFVRRELGALADPDESNARLRDTLRSYFKQGCDAAATGDLLRLHPNTVRYRIRQAEKSIGHSIAQRRVQIEVALEIVCVLGVPPSMQTGFIPAASQNRSVPRPAR